MRNAKEVEKELERAGIGDTWGFRWQRRVKLFAENLSEDEHILGGVFGVFRERLGRLVATENRLLFIETKDFFGSIVESFSYSRINDVTANKNVISGSLTIISGASTEQIKRIAKDRITTFLKLVQEQLASYRHGGPVGVLAPTIGNNDIASQLERLAALRDRGVLNSQEFQAQKEKILSQ